MRWLFCVLLALLIVAPVVSPQVVQAFDHVFSVQVDGGDLVRGKGRFRTNRRGITHYRTRGIIRQGSDYGGCDTGAGVIIQVR